MRVTLEYNLPEEYDQAEIAFAAEKWRGVVTDMLEHFRQMVKHPDNLTPEEHKIYIKAQSTLIELTNDAGLEVW